MLVISLMISTRNLIYLPEQPPSEIKSKANSTKICI